MCCFANFNSRNPKCVAGWCKLDGLCRFIFFFLIIQPQPLFDVVYRIAPRCVLGTSGFRVRSNGSCGLPLFLHIMSLGCLFCSCFINAVDSPVRSEYLDTVFDSVGYVMRNSCQNIIDPFYLNSVSLAF